MTVLSAGSPGPTAPAVCSVAFCPCPPVLLPEVEGRAVAETDELRRACAAAVGAVLAAGHEIVVVVGPGAASDERFGAGDAGTLRGFGVSLEIGFAGPAATDGSRIPLAHTIGARLLDDAGFPGARVGVAPETLASVLAEQRGSIGILAMGDGSARRSLKAPGYLDEAAEPFDRAVAAALDNGDAAALAALDPAAGERLLAAGTTTWRAVGAAMDGRRIAGRLHYDDAPFGVGYLVADWTTA